MAEITKFPKTFKKPQIVDDDVISSIEDVDAHMFGVKIYHIAETGAYLADNIFHNLALSGFDLDMDKPESHRDIAMLMETLKSLMMRHHDMEHPIQHITDKLLDKDADGNMIMKVPKNDNL